jgi:TonB family protein
MLPPNWMIELAAKATILTGLAFLVMPGLQRCSAALRHRVWLALFTALAALPLLIYLAPHWSVAALAPAARAEAVARTVITVTADGGSRVPMPDIWAWLWGVGCAVLLIRSLVAQVRAWHVAVGAKAWFDEVRLSERIDIPVVCGFSSPAIVLPEEAAAWPEERVELVLRHERAHVARRDPLARALAAVVCALYWPLIWTLWAARRMDIEAEMACDDAVLSGGQRATVYADHLVAIVRGLQVDRRVPEGGLPMIRISDLEQRLRAMLRVNSNRAPVARSAALGLLAASLMVLVPLAAARPPAMADGAGIQGVVKDASGAVVPRARIIVQWPNSERKEIVVTSEAGEFSVAPVEDGDYAITVQKPGFAALKMAAVKVRGGQSERLELMLKTGAVQETLTVTSEGPVKAAEPAKAGEPKRLKVGGNVQALKLVSQPKPTYPAECKAEGVQGVVLLRAVISREGDIVNLEPINRMVDKRLVEAAMAVVKQWKYQPTLLNGNPVEVQTEIMVNYELRP